MIKNTMYTTNSCTKKVLSSPLFDFCTEEFFFKENTTIPIAIKSVSNKYVFPLVLNTAQTEIAAIIENIIGEDCLPNVSKIELHRTYLANFENSQSTIITTNPIANNSAISTGLTFKI